MHPSLDTYTTLCCKAGHYRKGRANYRCAECGGDVTMELYYVYLAINEEEGQT